MSDNVGSDAGPAVAWQYACLPCHALHAIYLVQAMISVSRQGLDQRPSTRLDSSQVAAQLLLDAILKPSFNRNLMWPLYLSDMIGDSTSIYLCR